MPRLSKLIEKLEDRLEPHVGPWYERHKKRLPLYTAGGLVGWYFYGMLLNSIKLGTASTFHKSGEAVIESIWVFNPFRNWFVLFTPFGLGATAVIALLICLVTRKGFNWLSGNQLTHGTAVLSGLYQHPVFPDPEQRPAGAHAAGRDPPAGPPSVHCAVSGAQARAAV